MSAPEAALFVTVGAAAGFAGGLFAIGGALLAVPLLAAGFGFTQHAAQGSAMVMALSSACVTLAVYVRRHALRVRDALLITGSSTLLGLASSQAVRYVPDAELQIGFGIFLVLLAVLVWRGHLGENDALRALSTASQIGVGGLAGALSGLFVVGGALVSVPLLERIGGYSQQHAQGTVLLMLVPASAVGLASYAGAGYVRWGPAIALALGAVALAPLGARVALATRPRLLRRWFAIVQGAAGLALVLGGPR